MTSTHKTNNLHLSQFEESDQPKWLCDYNKDMKKIDEGVALKADVETALEAKANKGPAEKVDLPLDIAGGLVTPSNYRSYYCKNAFGEVSGVVSVNGNLRETTLLATLPEKFRPEEFIVIWTELWNTNATKNFGAVALNIATDGRITISNKTQQGILIIQRFSFSTSQ